MNEGAILRADVYATRSFISKGAIVSSLSGSPHGSEECLHIRSRVLEDDSSIRCEAQFAEGAIAAEEGRRRFCDCQELMADASADRDEEQADEWRVHDSRGGSDGRRDF